MEARLKGGIATVGHEAWDALAPVGNPFLSAAFLDAAERSGSASTRTGWQPLHLTIEDDDELIAAAPLYAKSHSWGEYVFDHGWAEALERAGGRYYPKLQVAVPFTPVPGQRLLARDSAARGQLVAALAVTLEQAGVSSLHVTFCTEDEALELRESGFLLRRGIQYHWNNAGFRDFADFLDGFRSAKRKMVRKERDEVRASGLQLRTLTGDEAAAALDEFYPFYQATVDKRWGNAYLTPKFFRRLGRSMPERIVLVTARDHGRMVAAALNILGDDTLYGRLWGCLDDYRFLHFECCYYQAIDIAIARGLARVEAGAQGSHKLARGYAPAWTHSAHLIRNPSLRAGISRFLDAETGALEEEMIRLQASLPFRQPDAGTTP